MTQEDIDRAFEAQKKESERRTQEYVWKLLSLLEKLERKSKSRRLEVSFLREDLAGALQTGRVSFENGQKTAPGAAKEGAV